MIITIVAIVLSIISIGFCGYIYYTKVRYQNRTASTLKEIRSISLDLASRVPPDLLPRLNAVEQLTDKTIAGVLGLVKTVTVNNRNNLRIALDNKYWNSTYADRLTSVVGILTNNLINVLSIKITQNSIMINIPFGRLFINTDNGDYKQEGEFSNFDLTFLKGNTNIT